MPGDRNRDRHLSLPKAVRMPNGLQEWYEKRAAETGQSVNAAIVAALEDYRGRHGSGTITSMGTAMPAAGAALSRPGTLSALTPEPAPEPENCKHPVNRRIGDYCAACERTVGKGKS